MAPEVVRGERYAFPVDWFGLGCIVFEMLAGRSPFRRRKERVKREEIDRRVREDTEDYSAAGGDCESLFSQSAEAFCRALLAKDPAEPGGAKQLREHDFFRGAINWRRLEAGVEPVPFSPDPHAVYAKDVLDIEQFSTVKGVHLDDKDQDFYSRFNTGAHPVPGGDDRDECFADLEVYYSASGGLVDSLNPDLPRRRPRKACFRSFSAAAGSGRLVASNWDLEAGGPATGSGGLWPATEDLGGLWPSNWGTGRLLAQQLRIWSPQQACGQQLGTGSLWPATEEIWEVVAQQLGIWRLVAPEQLGLGQACGPATEESGGLWQQLGIWELVAQQLAELGGLWPQQLEDLEALWPSNCGTAEPALPAPLARASQRPDWFNRTRPARKAILLPLERKRKPEHTTPPLAASIQSQQQSGSRCSYSPLSRTDFPLSPRCPMLLPLIRSSGGLSRPPPDWKVYQHAVRWSGPSSSDARRRGVDRLLGRPAFGPFHRPLCQRDAESRCHRQQRRGDPFLPNPPARRYSDGRLGRARWMRHHDGLNTIQQH
uniref:G protein-coupled receptor kinase n=1 Tax=Macrostomum lignano TaxID=282301 RepID=A0A1I8JPR2_9PLAT